MTRTGSPCPNPCMIRPQGIAMPTKGYAKQSVLRAPIPISSISGSSVYRPIIYGAAMKTTSDAAATIVKALLIP